MGDFALRDNGAKGERIKKKKQPEEKDINGLEDVREEKQKREYVVVKSAHSRDIEDLG